MDYGEAEVAEDMSDRIPNSVLFNLTQTVVQNGKPSLQVVAGEAATFSKKKQTILSEAEFREYDKEGNVVMNGKADKSIYYTDSENAELSGNLFVYSSTEEAGLEGEYLFWEKKTKMLRSRPEDSIIIKRDSGSIVEGKGFEADFKHNEVYFRNNAAGTYVSEE